MVTVNWRDRPTGADDGWLRSGWERRPNDIHVMRRDGDERLPIVLEQRSVIARHGADTVRKVCARLWRAGERLNVVRHHRARYRRLVGESRLLLGERLIAQRKVRSSQQRDERDQARDGQRCDKLTPRLEPGESPPPSVPLVARLPPHAPISRPPHLAPPHTTCGMRTVRNTQIPCSVCAARSMQAMNG